MAIEPYRRGSLVPRGVDRHLRYAREDGLVAAAKIEALQFATQTAMLAAASVSMLETTLIPTVPLGEPRFKMIGDAFAVGATNVIYRLGMR